tara:strand:- start:126 stop:371 length:246 start_codon:yes stop_codon:yes gene_type:complete
MIKLYIIGLSILLTAILANTIAGYININTWYGFSNLILEKGSFLKALKEQSIIDILWLFFLYPLTLGFGYLIAEKLFNIFS